MMRKITGTARGADRQRYEHWLFSGIALLALVEVFIGFGPTYYLAGVFSAPLPNALVHVHGAIFTLFLLLFITQTSLVAIGRTDWHRRLGIVAAVVACLLVILGVLVATEDLANHGTSDVSNKMQGVNYAVFLSDILMFTVLMACALRFRSRPVIHKRLALIALLSILDPAYDRWPIPVSWWDDRVSPIICTYPILLLIMVYDRFSTRTVQPATLWATGLLVAVQQGRNAFGHTAFWQSFSAWIYSRAHGFWLFQTIA